MEIISILYSLRTIRISGMCLNENWLALDFLTCSLVTVEKFSGIKSGIPIIWFDILLKFSFLWTFWSFRRGAVANLCDIVHAMFSRETVSASLKMSSEDRLWICCHVSSNTLLFLRRMIFIDVCHGKCNFYFHVQYSFLFFLLLMRFLLLFYSHGSLLNCAQHG